MQCHHCLLLHRLHRHWGKIAIADRLQQRLGIGTIGLVAVAVARHVCRVQQLHLMATPPRLPSPVMRGAARFEQHLGRCMTGQEARERGTGEPAARAHHAGCLGDRHLEHGLGEIDTDLYR